MQDHICLVTGANAGIGRATAQELAAQGATVVMACRNPDRGQAARDAIAHATGNDRLVLLQADLSRPADINRLAEAFLDRFDRLDVLVNNAGLLLHRRATTPDGLETTFAVNHLAPYALTLRLLEPLLAAPAGRVVNVSSSAHHSADDDLDDWPSPRRYRMMEAYSRSKLGNVLFTTALARRLADTPVTVNALHPGMVGTDIGKWAPIGWFFKLGRPVLRSPAKGAQTVCYLATAPEVAGVSGRYFVDEAERHPARRAQDPALAERLWALSARLTGLDLDGTLLTAVPASASA